ncbi:MAG: hypothetical protein K2K57_08200 [Oscillospiraceae bacterium]|nr:hypothetical protein [Oscillospiraceae bacterium]
MAVSKAHIKASKKYNAKTYKAFTVNAKIAEYQKITDYCNKTGISKAQLLLRSAEYVIDNDIDILSMTAVSEEKTAPAPTEEK